MAGGRRHGSGGGTGVRWDRGRDPARRRGAAGGVQPVRRSEGRARPGTRVRDLPGGDDQAAGGRALSHHPRPGHDLRRRLLDGWAHQPLRLPQASRRLRGHGGDESIALVRRPRHLRSGGGGALPARPDLPRRGRREGEETVADARRLRDLFIAKGYRKATRSAMSRISRAATRRPPGAAAFAPHCRSCSHLRGDPCTTNSTDGSARALGREMAIDVVGHHGARVLVFPTTMGTHREWPDRRMHEVLADHISSTGWIQTRTASIRCTTRAGTASTCIPARGPGGTCSTITTAPRKCCRSRSRRTATPSSSPPARASARITRRASASATRTR